MECKIKYSIIIPVYKEAENLRILLPKLKKKLTKFRYEILVIDTIENLDNTKEIVKNNSCIYVSREIDNSYGSAVRTGIKKSKGEYVIFMDGDGSHDPSYLSKIIHSGHEIFDIVSASRYVKGGRTDNPHILNLMSRILNITFKVFLKIPMLDISNSFKMYRKTDLLKINTFSNNFDIIQEILIKLLVNKPSLKIKEIPFNFKERKYGATKRNLILFVITYGITLSKLIYIKYEKIFFSKKKQNKFR